MPPFDRPWSGEIVSALFSWLLHSQGLIVFGTGLQSEKQVQSIIQPLNTYVVSNFYPVEVIKGEQRYFNSHGFYIIRNLIQT